MHLRNSCTRSASSCENFGSPSVRFILNGGIFLLTLKFHETSQARSFTTGNDFIGRIVIGSPAGYLSMRSMHNRRGFPFTSALHEPHFPALQFQRTARSGDCVACTA